MQFASINGNVIHYADQGRRDGTAVVFANSLGTDFRIWDGVVDRFGGLIRCLRYDKRGHGLSGATPAPYRMDDHISDLEALLGHAGVAKAVVCGVSVGGMIAMGLAARRPDLVAGLVLCDTAHKIGTADLWNARIATVEQGGIASMSDAILDRWFPKQWQAANPDELAGYRNMLERCPVAGYAGTCAALRDADLTEAAKGLTMPVAMLVGSADASTPPDLVRSTHELIAGSSFEIIDGAGHLPCIDAPGDVARIIGAFLKENGIG